MPKVDTPVHEERRTGSGSGTGDLWRVIVLNDDHNTFDGVAAALASTIPGVTFARGMALATRIHTRGLAVVFTGHRELAEHYWQCLDDLGLTMAPLEQ
jgi:ATP-dependent Clp protease adaptor protein ClpS